jgi:hypothetical protein
VSEDNPASLCTLARLGEPQSDRAVGSCDVVISGALLRSITTADAA